MLIGLVTVLYNSNDVLIDFLDSLKRQSYKKFILIVVDNSPNNISKNIISKNCLDWGIEYVYAEQVKNVGVASANNIGIKIAFELMSAMRN